VSGAGLEAVPDASVARQLLDKVNAMNVATGAKGAAATLLFAATALLDPLA